MRKKALCLLGIAVAVLALGACKTNGGNQPTNSNSTVNPVQQTFTVAFEADGVRVATAKVKSGQTITDEIPDPVKDG